MAGVPGGGTFLNPLFQVVSFGAGTALGPVLRPVLQDLTNETWTLHPVRPPDALTLAAGVAQGQVDERVARAWAHQTGFGDAQFTALIDIANVGPGLAQAYRMWRRDQIGEGGFRRAVRRLGLEDEWIDDLVALKNERLDPAQIAVMVQRGIIPDPGFLPVGPPSGVGKVPPMPVAQIDAVTEAAASGIESERMAALTRIVGLPASPDLAARMTFRKIIDRVDFDRAIAEGNTRNEWADPLFEGFREIPTAHQFVEGRLRGWLDDAEMYAGTARHGMSRADTDLDFKISGRPLSFHQVFIGERRGGTYGPDNTGIAPAFLKALQESNIRPEWYQLAWAQRFTYPSAFVLRALTQNGDLSQAESERILLFVGWEPGLAKTVSTRWAGGTGAATDPLVKSATTQAITEIRSAFLIGQTDETQARDWLTRLGVTAATQDGLLPIWNLMREIPQKGLTAAQIVKAFKKLPAQWPRARALDELQLLGLTADDAATLLDE